MVVGRLYLKEGNDLLMRLCIAKEEVVPYMEDVHIAIGKMHLSPKQTLIRIGRIGIYWPTMNKDVHKYIRECT